MLINESRVMGSDPLLSLIGSISGRGSDQKLQDGIYEIGHFGSSHFLRDYEHYIDDLSVGGYGVCDSVDNLLDKCPELTKSERKFVVTVTPIRRGDEPKEGGWRWHKWGEYIGKYEPQCEYISDEPEIEEVLIYHVYEKIT